MLAHTDDPEEMMAWRNEGEEYEPSEHSDDRHAVFLLFSLERGRLKFAEYTKQACVDGLCHPILDRPHGMHPDAKRGFRVYSGWGSAGAWY